MTAETPASLNAIVAVQRNDLAASRAYIDRTPEAETALADAWRASSERQIYYARIAKSKNTFGPGRARDHIGRPIAAATIAGATIRGGGVESVKQAAMRRKRVLGIMADGPCTCHHMVERMDMSVNAMRGLIKAMHAEGLVVRVGKIGTLTLYGARQSTIAAVAATRVRRNSKDPVAGRVSRGVAI